ncbi:MAG: tetratricopeptide repeat protein [Deltaproteobacteria bacterium]|nr:tetratricopeptide repeat protein [Deltaproteobacteria bacterium]
MQGQVDRAIDLYSQSIGLHPTAEAYTFRGWAYSFQSRYEEAIAECKKAIEVDPTFGNPYNDIGSYLVALGKHDEAIEWLERAKVAPRYEPRHFPYMNLGRVYAVKGMVLSAIREFEEALRIRPDEPSCVAALEELRRALN